MQLIFRPELHASPLSQAHEGSLGPSPIDQASHHAYQVLIDAIVACQQEGWISPGDPAPLALTAWCTVHGLAIILLHGSLRRRMQEMQAVEDAGQLAEIVTQTLTRGLLARERTSETMIP
jgi:Tetracyclin repressor-like, C-terminal domain